MKEHQPILITGIPRSGASMIAGILDVCGVHGGVVDKMYEHKRVRDTIVKPYLQSVGIDEDGQYPIAKKIKFDYEKAGEIKDLILEQIRPKNNVWYYKDSRMLLFWELWTVMFPKAKWIIIRRSDEDIIKSCLRTSYMNAYNKDVVKDRIKVNTTEDGWKWWLEQYKDMIYNITLNQENVVSITPEKMIDNYEEIKKLMGWLNLEYNEKTIHNFIYPKLRKSIEKKGRLLWQ